MTNYYSKLDWEKFIQNAHPLIKDFHKKETKYLKNLSGHVLEIGSGTGRTLKVLSENCSRVIGIDKEKIMVLKSKANIKNLKNVEIHKQNAKNLEFERGYFDYVICMGSTFSNLGKDKVTVLKEMKRVLKKQGKMIISVYNEKALSARLESYSKDELEHTKITKDGIVYSKEGLFSEQFTKEKLQKLFNSSKLKYKITNLNPISYLCICKKN